MPLLFSARWTDRITTGGAAAQEINMELSTDTRNILRQYKELINQRRRDMELPPVTTAKILDSMCEYMTCQVSVYLCNQFIIQGGRTVPRE
jgi:hypothetical protein